MLCVQFVNQAINLLKLLVVLLQGGLVKACTLLMIAKLAGHHSGYECCIEESEALLKISFQLQDCVEQSELVTEELLTDYEVRSRFFGFSDAADAF